MDRLVGESLGQNWTDFFLGSGPVRGFGNSAIKCYLIVFAVVPVRWFPNPVQFLISEVLINAVFAKGLEV